MPRATCATPDCRGTPDITSNPITGMTLEACSHCGFFGRMRATAEPMKPYVPKKKYAKTIPFTDEQRTAQARRGGLASRAAQGWHGITVGKEIDDQ